MQMQGRWIVEMAELDSLSRSETSRIKAFIARSTDIFRLPYARRVLEVPRRCVFAGTVNHSDYLRDETGARRFWPIACGQVDLDALKRERDQLWAEALVRFRAGDVWWLNNEELVDAAEQEQAARYDGDPWDDVISRWCETHESVTVEQVLKFCIQKPKDQWKQADKIRIARCLKSRAGSATSIATAIKKYGHIGG